MTGSIPSGVAARTEGRLSLRLQRLKWRGKVPSSAASRTEGRLRFCLQRLK